MSTSSGEQTLADYVAIALSPALIMGLVGSLIFFLVEVLLGPSYPGQLLWILFFAVFGAVLVSRIAMSADIAERATLYGLVLGVLVWLAMMAYVKYPSHSPLAAFDWLVNAALILLTWWSAHRLTRDSTVMDDRSDGGAGLLQVAGLEKPVAPVPPAQADGGGKRLKRNVDGMDGWWARFARYRAEVGKRPHAPGVWVVYFSLAALPLFGLGQSLIPAHDVERRRYVFWLMAIYVGSGLGLLLTTSFLNLRRYLRQRSLHMPVAMTAAWLTGGGLIIAALLTLGALIPRPSPEYAIVDLGVLVGAKEREGSRNAQGRGWAKDGDKTAAAEGPREGGTAKSGKGKGKKQGADGSKEEGANKKDGDQSGGNKQKQGGPKGKANGDQRQDKGDGGGEGEGEKDADAAQPETQPEAGSESPAEVGKFLLNLLKWIVIAVIVLTIAFLAGRALLRFLANFTHWARGLLNGFQAFWDRLRNWWQGGSPAAILEAPVAAERPRPFATFRDPFATGEADQMSPAELVRYSFEALEGWANDRGMGRLPRETPLEFVERLSGDFPALERSGMLLANVYAGLAYARKNPTAEQVDQLRPFWQLLVDLVEQPLSTGVME